MLTYALLPADGSLSVAELNRRLAYLGSNHIPEQFSWGRFAFEVRPVAEIVPRSLSVMAGGFYDPDRPVDVLDALLIFARVILGVACLNFVNLATAQSASRARAIGTRTAMGARAGQISREDLVRTALVTAAAIVVALAALVPAARLLDGPSGRRTEPRNPGLTPSGDTVRDDSRIPGLTPFPGVSR